MTTEITGIVGLYFAINLQEHQIFKSENLRELYIIQDQPSENKCNKNNRNKSSKKFQPKVYDLNYLSTT